MKAVGIKAYGPASNLVDAEVPKPAAPSGFEILVKVHAVALNPVDWKVRRGYFDDPTKTFDAVPKVCASRLFPCQFCRAACTDDVEFTRESRKTDMIS